MTTEPCPHAEELTLLWLYGEGPEDHALHVATCAACTAVAEAHEEVAHAVGPVLGALAGPDAPVATARATPVLAAVTSLALAAAVLLAVGLSASPEPDLTADTDVLLARLAEPEPGLGVPLDADVDLSLDDLDYELEAMRAELGTL